MTYSITYALDTSPEVVHTRYYHALNKEVALQMFNETCTHGSLKGYFPQVMNIKKISKS